MQSKITMQGMYDWDNTLFDAWTLPDWMDKDTLINAILWRCGEFEVLFPAFQYLKLQIGAWGERHNRTFTKWNEALQIEFNPLDNYDRHEEYTDEKWNNGENSATTSATRSSSESSSGSTEQKVSAYDSAAYAPKQQDSASGSRSMNETDGGSVSGSNSGHEKITHGAHLWGNIGVTTSAAMLTEFLEVERFSIYDQIADLFVQDFCLMIY